MTGEEFTRRANEVLPEDYKVEFYGSSQLGNDKEMMQKLKLGTVHFSMPSSIMTSIVPEFGLFDMPFLVQDRAHLNRIEHAIVWPKLAPLAGKKGYKIIAFVENGFRQITNNVRPIVKPGGPEGHQAAHAEGRVAGEDVRGLRRQPDSDVVLGSLRGAPDRHHRRTGKIRYRTSTAPSSRKCRNICR